MKEKINNKYIKSAIFSILSTIIFFVLMVIYEIFSKSKLVNNELIILVIYFVCVFCSSLYNNTKKRN